MSPAPSWPSPHPDAELVARIRGGDAAAFELLFRTYHSDLRAFAVRYVDDVATAEDLVHDVFVAIWARRHDWSVQGGLRAYLFGAARNRAISHLRHQAHERRWLAAADRGPLGDSDRCSQNEGVRNLEREERARLVTEVLAALPERCRTAVVLRWQRQLSYAEIAEVMGISIKTVEIHLTRGAKLLRARYREAFPGE
jgi:RNA polymerase sigma-70 factor, ECF subfamily